MNDLIEWDTNLAIGIEAIDAQHKSLFSRLNQVAAAMNTSQEEKSVASTLDFLIKYTDYHFSKEEEYMEKYKYPGINEQKEKHDEYRKLLTEMEQEFIEDGATKNLANAINTLLGNWLIKHIKGMDLEFGKFLKEKHIEIPPEINGKR